MPASPLTARKIIQNFKNLYSGGRQTDDVSISDRQWLFNLDHHRAQLLRQQVEKGQTINEANLQELGDYIPAMGCRAIKVKKQICGRWFTDDIPAVVEVYQKNLFTFVGSTAGEAYQKTSAQKSAFDQYATYTKRQPKWYQLGSTLYLTSPPGGLVTLLTVRGVFENPREVMVYNGDLLDEFDYLNFPYPISRTALDTITKMLADSELKLMMGLPADHNNDSREEHQAQR